ncbi:helix-turn-helix domain-containing protein [Chelativorans sp. AA-79]|uniref:helix-turn-helix domain-containing protein n=1 Tax=Chelativorans sp. AA-79 TaxID=3028735 RepID=UPI0023F64755|nr:helix-turn-helix domain-containing protein [Chelativorans sp. AA-79]WEX09493.1 helix-turn-helix domain-containing protein [Chelativorans sp. AA-79]
MDERNGAGAAMERRRWPRGPETGTEAFRKGAPVLKPLKFSTRSLPARDQFGAWQDYMKPLADLRLPDDVSTGHGFPADHVAWNLGKVLIVQQRAPAHSYERSAIKLRASPIDHWSLGLLRSGQSWTEVDRRVAHNVPGKAELRTLGYPFRGRITEAESLIFYMPRDLFGDASAILDDANNSIRSGNLARLLIDYVSSVEASLCSLVAEDLPGIAQTLRNMMTVSVPSGAHKPTADHQAAGLMERARRHVHQHLASPELTPDSLCQELGISRTRLYQLFESSGGVLHYIRKKRLLAAHAALSDPANGQRILEIAEAVGFDTPANFSRAFKAEFGYSPRDARDPMSLGRGAFGNAHLPESTETFGSWLETLAN